MSTPPSPPQSHTYIKEGGREGGKTYLIIERNCNGRSHGESTSISSNRPENKAMGMITTEPAAIAAVVFLKSALSAYPIDTAAFAHKIKMTQNVKYAPAVGRNPTMPYTIDPNTNGKKT